MKDGLLNRDDSFADDLAHLRTQQGMSESELAEKMGVTPQCIRAYESGKRRPQDWTVQGFNDTLLGRNSWGITVSAVDTPEGSGRFSNLRDVPDDALAAEVRRRLLSGSGE